MIAKTPNIRCFVAKTHLSRSTHFFRQLMSPFYPFRRGGSLKGDNVTVFLPFFIAGLPLSALPIDLVSVQISVVSYTRVKLSRVSMEQ